jgi:hypothetical protein
MAYSDQLEIFLELLPFLVKLQSLAYYFYLN